jgi:CubicO group peptidase (beta-lactamase class C family)
VVRAGVAAAALVACATTFVVVSTAEVLVEPGKTIQATADTVPASGVGLQVRTRKIEASAAPAARAEASAARPAAGPTPLPGAEVAEPVQGAATVSSDELDRALASWLADWNIAGVSAALRRADGEAWTGASGSTEDGAPFLASEHYGIASISKTFTVALVLRLVERGLVDLDAPAGDYLPDFPPAQYFTVRQLIQHTSGLIVGDALPYLSLLEAAEAGLQFEPGTASLYSRAGYYLLGLIIEETLGRSYTQALHEELLEPLGLSETNMDEEVAPFEFSTHPYEAATAGLEGVIFSSGGLSRDRRPAASYFGALWSSGGVWSTTSDLARWALALWGGDHVVSDAWRPEMSKFLGPEFDYVGLGTYPACPCWLEGGRLRSARLSHLGANGMIEYDLQDGTALAVRVSATVADANVVEALDDLRNRLWSLVLGRSFAPPDALAYHKAAIPPAQDADDNEAAIPPAQDALGVEP